MKANVVNILDLINPTFYSLWLSEKSHNACKGGRSSMKSSVISLKLVVDFLNDEQGNVVCLRKVAKYLSTSIYEQIKWAIYTLQVGHEFTFQKSPLKIIHNRTQTAFYFYGVDDPMKLKSAKIAKGYVSALWFEELAEFAGVEDIDIVEDTFIREELPGGKQVKVYFSYNPPRNPYSWINEWIESKKNDDSYFIHHSTYLDDKKGFLSTQILEKIERYREHDEDYWRWMYLGEVIGLGDNVYNVELFNALDDIPDDEVLRELYFATDSGHQVSATTTVAVGLTSKNNLILLDTYYYSPEGKVRKKAPSQLAEDIFNFVERVRARYMTKDWAGRDTCLPVAKETIDSAEGALRNQYYLDYDIKLHPVAKKKKADMIDHVHDLLAQGRFYYLNIPSNEIFIEEHRKYQWDADTLHSDKPEVVKENDHTCDAFQYLLLDNLRDFGLKY